MNLVLTELILGRVMTMELVEEQLLDLQVVLSLDLLLLLPVHKFVH
jgi:hypothetical protein